MLNSTTFRPKLPPGGFDDGLLACHAVAERVDRPFGSRTREVGAGHAGVGKIRACQISTGEVGIGQVAAAKVDPRERGMVEVRTHIGAAEVGVVEIRVGKIGAWGFRIAKQGPHERGFLKRRFLNASVGEIGTVRLRAIENRLGHVGRVEESLLTASACEISAPQIGVAQIGVRQIDAGQIGLGQMLAGKLLARQGIERNFEQNFAGGLLFDDDHSPSQELLAISDTRSGASCVKLSVPWRNYYNTPWVAAASAIRRLRPTFFESASGKAFCPKQAHAAADRGRLPVSTTGWYDSKVMTFRVELNIYRGPLDLLLYLVRKHELDISDIPIALVTEQFLAHLDVLEQLSVDDVGEFLDLASTLVEIKSRMVLPSADEVDEPLEDPRQELVQRLLEYKRFREAASVLDERGRQWQRRYPRLSDDLPPRKIDPANQPIREVELWDLVSALGRLMKFNAPRAASIVYDETPVRVWMERLHTRLARDGQVTFSEFFAAGMHKSSMIGVFLAILELVRHHHVLAEQGDGHGEIIISRGERFSDSLELGNLDEYEGSPPLAADVATDPK